jgi:predicted MFS family arabinose efflux permease
MVGGMTERPGAVVPVRSLVALGVITSLTMAAGTVAGPAIGVLASVLRDEFGITRAEVGRLAGLYAISGALVSPLAGRLADRIGGRPTMVITAAGGAATFVVFALAPSYTWLMVMAVVAGLPNGGSNPGTNRVVAGLVPLTQRGTVTGVKQSGVQLGRFVAGISLPAAVAAFGLRSALLLAAVAIAGIAIAIPLALPADPRPEPSGSASAGPARMPPAVWWLAAYATLMGAGAGATFAFTALFAEERMGFTNQEAGVLVAVSGLVAVVSRIALAHSAQTSAHFAVPLERIALGAAASLLLMAAAPDLGAWALWLSVAAGAVTLGSWNSVAMLATMASTPTAQAGRAAGWVVGGFLAGLGVAPPLFGAVVDRYDAYEQGWLAVAVTALAAAAATRVWRLRELRLRPS